MESSANTRWSARARESGRAACTRGACSACSLAWQAAFVDIGLEKNAFLPLSGSGSVRGGQELLVQVLKDPPGETKGLRLTREITLPGRLCVLKPGGAGVSVSRKLAAPAQERLRALGGAICPPDCGLLLRTQAESADDADIETEARALYERLLSIERAYANRSGPGLVLQEEDLAGRMLRDPADARYRARCGAGGRRSGAAGAGAGEPARAARRAIDADF